MRVYIYVVIYHFLRFLYYPSELAGYFTRRAVSMFCYLFFWYAIGKSNPDKFDIRQLLSYFLLVESLRDLTLCSGTRFAGWMNRQIRTGELNNILIKPANAVFYSFSQHIGERFPYMFISLVFLTLGLALYPAKNPISYLLFLPFWFISLGISFSFNLLLGLTAFVSPEVAGLRWVYDHLNDILSGKLIPLSFFPIVMGNVLTALPSIMFWI